MKCPACNAEQSDDTNFCDQCGFKFGSSPPADNSLPPVVDLPGEMPCPHCGHANPSGGKYCEQCGESIAPSPSPMYEPSMPSMGQPNFEMPSPSMRFRMINGASIIFGNNPNGVWLIGREDPVTGVSPDIDLTPYDPEMTVSRRHAQISLEGGIVKLTSISTTNRTKINGVPISPNESATINTGDKIEFAKCAVVFVI